ncbi:acyltransferase [Allokutzneria sp. A3M-2-11 16]|uniref:acyltransferase family protein n=1 Tax=Allokutzneria sp. A3M-2-11 16 TaxID=2962043 RepID=UPI0020B83595|nr:acyltransferase [Allokutzneria sp. A3M-2-11 16]MCP3801120.1 acyltransferase [Allokutzneria sp. A3M-2-11 16]
MKERNPVIDAVRVGSVGLVVFAHWFGAYVGVDNGVVRVGIGVSGPVMWALTWLLQVMPLVFFAGGYANAAGVDAARARGESFLAKRAMALMIPAIPLVMLFTAASTVGGALGLQPVATVGQQVMKPLWFLAIYLVVVCVAPLMVRLHDRFGMAVPLAMTAVVSIVDFVRFSTVGLVADIGVGGDINFLLVWLTAHQFGIAYARGAFARYTRPALYALIVVAVAAMATMVFAGPYPPSMLGLPGVLVSNLSPPTLAMIMLSFAQVCVFLLVAPWAERKLSGDRAQRFLKRANPSVMPVYLWHLPAGAMLLGIALLAPQILLPSPGLGWWLSRPLWLAVSTLALLGVLRVVRRVHLALPTVDSRWPLVGLLICAYGVREGTRHGLDLTNPQASHAVLAMTVGVAVLLVESQGKRLGAAWERSAGATGRPSSSPSTLPASSALR